MKLKRKIAFSIIALLLLFIAFIGRNSFENLLLGKVHFPEELFGTSSSEKSAAPLSAHTTLAEARRKVVENFEQQYLKALFARNRGKVKKSAAEAGITPRQLNKLMLKYDIRKEDFKV